MMLRIALSLSLTVALVSSALAQSTQPVRTYDWTTPLAAAASFREAIDAEDHQAVTSAYHAANDDERALLDALAEQAAAGAAMHEACLWKFQRGLPRIDVPPGSLKLEADIRGEETVVYFGGKEPGLGVNWVRVNDEWKMAMSQVLRVHL